MNARPAQPNRPSTGPPVLTVHAEGRTRTITPGPEDRNRPLTSVLRAHGMPLNTRCGERGLCHGCTVALHGRARDSGSGQPRTFAGESIRACEIVLATDTETQPGPGKAELVIDVPPPSVQRFAAHAVSDFDIDLAHGHDPLPTPGLGGGRLAAAVDVGTTTVAVLLVNPANGEVLARAGAFNRQIDFGDNVLTRINRCAADPAAVAELQDALVNRTLEPLLDQALEQAHAHRGDIGCLTAAGNPTMLHLLAGENPASLGIAPFTPIFLEHRVMPLSATGFRWADRRPEEPRPDRNPPPPPDPDLHLLPSAAAYIGSDLTAGVVATGMRYRPGTHLLIDVGTNGEIVLAHRGQLIGCATAAGPAFEGGGLADGIRAGEGAIGRIDIRSDPLSIEVEVVGGGKAMGLCGSAYIDLMGQGRSAGLLTPTGRLRADRLYPPDHPGPGAMSCDGRALVIAHGQGRRPIQVRESDIAKLLQAKAAIAAGILTLLDRRGLGPTDVDTVYLAGGFGRHVHVEHAIACGLLPGFQPRQVRPVGNLALAGAYLVLLDRSLLTEMAEAARAIEPIELNLDPRFEDHYIDALSLPEPPRPRRPAGP